MLKVGDVHCVVHIINLVVQEELNSLEADLEADFNSYCVEEHGAQITPSIIPTAARGVIGCLTKLRQYVFVFNNCQG